MANKKITSLKRTIKKYLLELLNEKKVGGRCTVKYSDGTKDVGVWSIGDDGQYYCSTGGESLIHYPDGTGKTIVNPSIDPKVYKLKSANTMRERDELPTDTDGCQCCRDKVVATGSFGGCCRWCKGGKVAAPTMDMSEKRKMANSEKGKMANSQIATKSCPCCKTGYESCCQDCFHDGLLPESTMLNEGPYCNPDGADPSTVPGCQKHGVGCLGDGFFGTMSYNSGSDSFECGMVTPGGTGGGPLSGDDLVVKTKGGNKNPFYKPKSSIDQMMREAAKDIVREGTIRKWCWRPRTGISNKCCERFKNSSSNLGGCMSYAACHKESDCGGVNKGHTPTHTDLKKN
jgi:hypothetical protein